MLVDKYTPWNGVQLKSYLPPKNYPDHIDAPNGLKVAGGATTQRVRLT